MKLNENQRNAVTYEGDICVSACPGSGKTRTIVAKLIHCIDKVRDTSRRLACITYTHAAVNEIEIRLREYGSIGDEDYCEIGTIHSFCLTNILQPFHYLLPEFHSGFDVISPDSERWYELIRQLSEKFKLDSRQYDVFNNIHRKPDHTLFVPPEIPDEAAIELIAHLDRNQLISFSDIVYHSFRLISSSDFISRGLASRFAWMLIDEFQDTTEGQVAILRMIASHGKTNFFLVGDPNQSIMSFAGAHPSLMQTFPKELKAKTDIRLYGNYRSSQQIINHAELLIPSYPKMQPVGPCKNCKVEPQKYHVESPIVGIFDYYLPAVEELNIPLGESAVLSPWWLPLYHLARNLRDRSIPIIGPGARPYKRTRFFSGFAEHLCAYIEDCDPDLFSSLHRSLFLMLLNMTGNPVWSIFSYDGRKCLCRIAAIAKEISEEYNTEALSWLKTTSSEISKILLSNEYLPINFKEKLSESVDDMIRDMEKNGVDTANLSIFDLGIYARPRDCLQLITMHSAKGREFDAVAIIDLHNGRVPHFSCRDEEQYNEARRQLYVALTRPRKLLMCFTDYSNRRNQPSPFLAEMGII